MIFITYSLKTNRFSIEYEKPATSHCLTSGDYTFSLDNLGTRIWFVMPEQDEILISIYIIRQLNEYYLYDDNLDPEYSDSCEVSFNTTREDWEYTVIEDKNKYIYRDNHLTSFDELIDSNTNDYCTNTFDLGYEFSVKKEKYQTHNTRDRHTPELYTFTRNTATPVLK
jgi:hypothetical protein